MKDGKTDKRWINATANFIVVNIWLIIFGLFYIIGEKTEHPYFDFPWPDYSIINTVLIAIFSASSTFLLFIWITSRSKIDKEGERLIEKRWKKSCVIILIFFQFYPLFPEVWERLENIWEATSFWVTVRSVVFEIIFIIFHLLAGAFLLFILFYISVFIVSAGEWRIERLFYKTIFKNFNRDELIKKIERPYIFEKDSPTVEINLEILFKNYFNERDFILAKRNFLDHIKNIIYDFLLYAVLIFHLFTPWTNWSILSGFLFILKGLTGTGEY